MTNLSFNQRVLNLVKRIKTGEFKTYKEIAALTGKPSAYRAIGNILAKNRDRTIPCHRVVKTNGIVGGYLGEENLSWEKLALLLREGVIAVMPTDTLYGLCGLALNKKTVEKIYRLKKRNPQKPFIILIANLNDLKKFDLKLSSTDKEILKKLWPARISIILESKDKRFTYLDRGTKTLAFRVPRDGFLQKVLRITGPLVAPSANWEGKKPSETISAARQYFKNQVVYFDAGKITGQPSTLIKLKNGQIEILRKGADFPKLKPFLY